MFCTYSERLLRRTSFSEVGSGRKMVGGGQWMRWEKSMKTPSSGLAGADAVRLTVWGLEDPSRRRLETIGEMAQCRSR